MSTPARSAILAADASGGLVSVAISTADGPILELSAEGRAGTVLHDLLAKGLDAAGLRARDLSRLAVSRGPGSFTGLRVGLATIQGLSLATGVPAVGIETTRAIALAAGRSGRTAVVLDGGQGRVFTAVHEVDVESGAAATVQSPLDLSPETAAGIVATVGRGVLSGHPPGEAILLEAGCAVFDGALAGAVAILARDERLDADTLQALYARAPAIRPSST